MGQSSVGVALASSHADLAAEADLIISAVTASQAALKKAGWSVGDLDLIEARRAEEQQPDEDARDDEARYREARPPVRARRRVLLGQDRAVVCAGHCQ